MKAHQPFEDMLLLYFYDELSNGNRKIFESHLSSCPVCTKKLAQLTTMKNSLNAIQLPRPSTVLIERANAKVLEKIRAYKRFPLKDRIMNIFDDLQEALTGIFTQPRYQLVSLGVTLIIGMFIGKLWLSSGLRHDPGMLANFVNYQAALTDSEKENLQKALANYLLQSGGIEVAELVQGDPDTDGDGIVEVNVKVEKDFALKGGLDDPTIINMLQYSALNEKDKARRLHALKLLAKTHQNPNNESTFISVLLNDTEQDVRMLALETLRSYTIDEQILDTYKTLALRDSSSLIRSIVLENLYTNADATVIPILALIASNDENGDIRDTAQKYLDDIMKNSNQ